MSSSTAVTEESFSFHTACFACGFHVEHSNSLSKIARGKEQCLGSPVVKREDTPVVGFGAGGWRQAISYLPVDNDPQFHVVRKDQCNRRDPRHMFFPRNFKRHQSFAHKSSPRPPGYTSHYLLVASSGTSLRSLARWLGWFDTSFPCQRANPRIGTYPAIG